MSRKKIMLIVLGIIAIGIITLIFQRKNNMTSYDVENIKYDIKIEYQDRFVETGYATEYNFYLININEGKIYKIHDYYVFSQDASEGEQGHHYKVKTKKIKKEDIYSIVKYIELFNGEDQIDETSLKRGDYWTISYEEERIIVKSLKESIIDLLS